MKNNEVKDADGKVIGFRCSRCDQVKTVMWEEICNECREAASVRAGNDAYIMPPVPKESSALGATPEPGEQATRVLQMALSLIYDPDDPTGSFEHVGELYHRETGFLRPGKSEPMETGRDSNTPENLWRFAKWWDDKRREAIVSLKTLLAPSVFDGNDNQPADLIPPKPSAPAAAGQEEGELADSILAKFRAWFGCSQFLPSEQRELRNLINASLREKEEATTHEIENAFMDRMALRLKAKGVEWSDCDGDDDPATIIGDYFANRIIEAERLAAGKEPAHKCTFLEHGRCVECGKPEPSELSTHERLSQ